MLPSRSAGGVPAGAKTYNTILQRFRHDTARMVAITFGLAVGVALVLPLTLWGLGLWPPAVSSPYATDAAYGLKRMHDQCRFNMHPNALRLPKEKFLSGSLEETFKMVGQAVQKDLPEQERIEEAEAQQVEDYGEAPADPVDPADVAAEASAGAAGGGGSRMRRLLGTDNGDARAGVDRKKASPTEKAAASIRAGLDPLGRAKKDKRRKERNEQRRKTRQQAAAAAADVLRRKGEAGAAEPESDVPKPKMRKKRARPSLSPEQRYRDAKTKRDDPFVRGPPDGMPELMTKEERRKQQNSGMGRYGAAGDPVLAAKKKIAAAGSSMTEEQKERMMEAARKKAAMLPSSMVSKTPEEQQRLAKMSKVETERRQKFGYTPPRVINTRFERQVNKLADEKDFVPTAAGDYTVWAQGLDDLGAGYAKKELHRLQWEWAQALYAIRKFDLLTDSAMALAVGAGTEPMMYHLANKMAMVTAVDQYDSQFWQGQGTEPEMLTNPAKFAPFSYKEDHLQVMHMSATDLLFEDEQFDVVYSFETLESLGGHAAAEQAVAEMARVLVPGGLLVLSTSLILNGVVHYADAMSMHRDYFLPDELEEHVIMVAEAAGLELLEEVDLKISRQSLQNVLDIDDHEACANKKPHVVLHHQGSVYTSALVAFFKPVIDEDAAADAADAAATA